MLQALVAQWRSQRSRRALRQVEGEASKGCIGVMEKKMETSVILGLYWDNGKENGSAEFQEVSTG